MHYISRFDTSASAAQRSAQRPDIVVFLDGDYSDYPAELTKIVALIIEEDIDFVLGSRVKELREDGSMTFPQRFGNGLATSLMKLFFNSTFTDLRSEEHTSELQSRPHLVCRLLLEKKKKNKN